MSPASDLPVRDHLFISYASEDGALAEWLALRLTAEGYKVWIYRFELLGGEPFPEDIDRAIEERTFRMLGLISEHSLNNPDPSGEWTKAINLGREREENFLIPINVDGLSPARLNWRISRLTFIPFSQSWKTGLAQLLEKLADESAPKGAVDGRKVAASAYLPDEVRSGEPEPVYANLLRFERIPEVLSCYQPWRRLSSEEQNALADIWAFWAEPTRIGRRRYFCFSEPPDQAEGISELSWDLLGSGEWRESSSFRGKYPEHILKPLLRRAILHHLRCKGLKPVSAENSTDLYFPQGLLPNDYLSFTMPDGRTTRRKVVGERVFPGSGDRYRYHQVVTVDILRDLEPRFVVKFRIRVHITGLDGGRLGPHSANARRTHLTKNWRNDQWLARHVAICTFMSNEDGKIVIGREDPVVVDGSLVELEAPRGINEEAIQKGAHPIFGTESDNKDGASDADEAELKGADVAG